MAEEIKKEGTQPQGIVKIEKIKKVSTAGLDRLLKQKQQMEEINNVYQALYHFQRLQKPLPRNGHGTTVKGKEYNYVTFDDLIAGIRHNMNMNGLLYTQQIQDDKMITELVHTSSGTKIVSSISLGNPANMQDYGARISYARRYSLTALLGLTSEDDSDAEGSTAKLQNTDIPIYSAHVHRAISAVESASSIDALEMLRKQIQDSTKLTPEEKETATEKVLLKLKEWRMENVAA